MTLQKEQGEETGEPCDCGAMKAKGRKSLRKSE